MSPSHKRYTLFHSILFAFRGILTVLKNERSLKIQSLVAFAVIGLGFWTGLNHFEWAVLLLIIFAVFSAEVFNSSLERLCDLVRDEEGLGYEATKLVRDIAAGAVLILAIASIILGSIIFYPHIFTY